MSYICFSESGSKTFFEAVEDAVISANIVVGADLVFINHFGDSNEFKAQKMPRCYIDLLSTTGVFSYENGGMQDYKTEGQVSIFINDIEFTDLCFEKYIRDVMTALNGYTYKDSYGEQKYLSATSAQVGLEDIKLSFQIFIESKGSV